MPTCWLVVIRELVEMRGGVYRSDCLDSSSNAETNGQASVFLLAQWLRGVPLLVGDLIEDWDCFHITALTSHL